MPTPIFDTGAMYYERSELGLPLVVTNMDRITARPPLANRLKRILVHYTGVPVTTRRYAFVTTFDQKLSVLRAINNWKRNEYNYMIFQDGTVFEFAGRFQAIHCGPWPAGRQHNPYSYGVLFVNSSDAEVLVAGRRQVQKGTGEKLTAAQIQSFAWLKNLLRWTKQVDEFVVVDGHRDAKPTGCPGDLIYADIDGLRSL